MGEPPTSLKVICSETCVIKPQNSSFLLVTRFHPLSFILPVLPILMIKILHLADAICVYIFVLPFHCWEPWHLYTICPSTKAAWCTLFPHIDKEQFNEIWELFLVRGQCPISELVVCWPSPIHWPSFQCMLRYPFKTYIQKFDDVLVIPHPTFHSQREWNHLIFSCMQQAY